MTALEVYAILNKKIQGGGSGGSSTTIKPSDKNGYLNVDGQDVLIYDDSKLVASKTSSEWATSSDIPNQGSILIEWKTDGSYSLKVGDGVNSFSNLDYVITPFSKATILDIILTAKKNIGDTDMNP